VPVVCYPGEYKRVGGISIDPFAAEMMEKSRKELVEERDAIKHLLPK
jgi:malate dehydrogenase